VDSAIELYKLPPSTTADQVIDKLKSELKAAITRAKRAIDARNRKLVALVKESKEPNVAIVFGGIHAAGIVGLLDNAGLGCTVVEPVGYQDDEAQLIHKLDEALKSL
jgi:hypothetical protein